MKTRLAKGLTDETLLMFWCPGCETHHGPRIAGGGSCWTWNGDRDRPTLSPSILCQSTRRLTDDEVARVTAGEHIDPVPIVCHSFVRDGRIEFLSDCTHRFAGQTIDLEDVS